MDDNIDSVDNIVICAWRLNVFDDCGFDLAGVFWEESFNCFAFCWTTDDDAEVSVL